MGRQVPFLRMDFSQSFIHVVTTYLPSKHLVVTHYPRPLLSDKVAAHWLLFSNPILLRDKDWAQSLACRQVLYCWAVLPVWFTMSYKKMMLAISLLHLILFIEMIMLAIMHQVICIIKSNLASFFSFSPPWLIETVPYLRLSWVCSFLYISVPLWKSDTREEGGSKSNPYYLSLNRLLWALFTSLDHALALPLACSTWLSKSITRPAYKPFPYLELQYPKLAHKRQLHKD